MLILDNIIFSLQRAGGISIVWENLIRGIRGKIPLKCIEYQGIENNIHRCALNLEKETLDSRICYNLLLEQLKIPKIHISAPFIFHSSYYRTSSNPYAVNVTTVHDFIYEMEGYRGSPMHYLRSKLNHRAILKSDVIVCISQNTKHDLINILPSVRNKHVEVIYNGVSSDYHPISDKIEEYEKSLLFVGGRQGYKNFTFAVQAAKHFSRNLIICGNNLTEQESEYLNKMLGVHGYEFILRPSNEKLNRIYNSVDVLLYPSSYEGFGIPLLEAQRCGCPVIAYSSSSIPEVIGETPLLLDSLDIKKIGDKLKLLEINRIRNEIIEAGINNSHKFSWDKMASQYLDLYNSLT